MAGFADNSAESELHDRYLAIILQGEDVCLQVAMESFATHQVLAEHTIVERETTRLQIENDAAIAAQLQEVIPILQTPSLEQEIQNDAVFAQHLGNDFAPIKRDTSRLQIENDAALAAQLQEVMPILQEDTRATSTQVQDKATCHICFCEFDSDQDLTFLPCAHKYHTECIDEWIKVANTCPICRSGCPPDVSAEPQMEQTASDPKPSSCVIL